MQHSSSTHSILLPVKPANETVAVRFAHACDHGSFPIQASSLVPGGAPRHGRRRRIPLVANADSTCTCRLCRAQDLRVRAPRALQPWLGRHAGARRRSTFGDSARVQVRPVPVQMWPGRAQSWCRCGQGVPSPGADVAGVSPVPGADADVPMGRARPTVCALLAASRRCLLRTPLQ